MFALFVWMGTFILFLWLTRKHFAWKESHRAGVWTYIENSVTKERRAYRYILGGYSPLDIDWLFDGPDKNFARVDGVLRERMSLQTL